MPILTTLIVLPLLIGPAPVDRGTTFSEVEAPAPTTTPDPQDPPPANASSDVTTAPDPVVSPEVTSTVTLVPTRMPAPPRPPVRPARPIRWRVDMVFDAGGMRFGDRAWRAFDSNRRAVQAGVSLRADARLGRTRVFLGGGASFRNLGGAGTLYETTSTYARVREPLLFARLSVAAVEGIDVFVQAGGGPSVVDLDFISNQSASQRKVVGLADGQGGVALYLPKRWLKRRGASRVTGGIELAAGYTWRGDVDVRPQVDTDEDPIPTSGAALGDLSLRGVTWRVGLFVRFQ